MQTHSIFGTEKSRTELAIAFHGPGPFPFGGKEYKLVSHELNFLEIDGVCSAGSSAEREVGFLVYSEKLRDTYFPLLLNAIRQYQKEIEEGETLTQPLDEMGICQTTESKTIQEEKVVITNPTEFLRPLVTLVESCLGPVENQAEMNAIVVKYNKAHELDLANKRVPLECFLEAKKGYCRHHALFTAYLLVLMVQEAKKNDAKFQIEKHRVMHYRGYIYKKNSNDRLVHTVTIYDAGEARYFIDGNHGVVADITQGNISFESREKYQGLDIVRFIGAINSLFKAPGLELYGSALKC